jgi:protein-S-isoprenylcysteine O-methyltransferase Ste14
MRLLRLPPRTKKHTEERLKLLASGAQLLALALITSALIAPLFTSTVSTPSWERWVAVGLAIVAEIAALTLLGFIPTIE